MGLTGFAPAPPQGRESALSDVDTSSLLFRTAAEEDWIRARPPRERTRRGVEKVPTAFDGTVTFRKAPPPERGRARSTSASLPPHLRPPHHLRFSARLPHISNSIAHVVTPWLRHLLALPACGVCARVYRSISKYDLSTQKHTPCDDVDKRGFMHSALRRRRRHHRRLHVRRHLCPNVPTRF